MIHNVATDHLTERRRNVVGMVEWRDVNSMSTIIRLNILHADIHVYSDLPDRGESGQLMIIPERVDWESVRPALAEQLRYNLRSPQYYVLQAVRLFIIAYSKRHTGILDFRLKQFH